MASYHKIRERFTSFWTDSAEHDGKEFAITGFVWAGHDDGLDNPEPRFNVRFADGSEFQDANAEEIFEGWASPDRETPRARAALSNATGDA